MDWKWVFLISYDVYTMIKHAYTKTLSSELMFILCVVFVFKMCGENLLNSCKSINVILFNLKFTSQNNSNACLWILIQKKYYVEKIVINLFILFSMQYIHQVFSSLLNKVGLMNCENCFLTIPHTSGFFINNVIQHVLCE